MPHVIARSDRRRNGRSWSSAPAPAGLEAARVAGERGHERDASSRRPTDPAGRSGSTAGLARRREILGIVDWRVAECERLGVEFRYGVFAEADDVLAEAPDVVVVATGGAAQHRRSSATATTWSTTTWDIMSGAAQARRARSLLYDDNGAHPGLTAAELLADAGAGARAGDTRADSRARRRRHDPIRPTCEAFAEHGVTVTLEPPAHGPSAATGNRLVARLRNEYAKRTIEKPVDQVVVEHGTLPIDDLYLDLKDRSRPTGGEVDHAALLAGRPQSDRAQPGRRLPAVPRRRRGRQPQHPRRRSTTPCA